MGAVISDEVSALKAFASNINAVAQANDARIAAEVDAITDSFSILVKLVRSLNERVADLERKADEMRRPKGPFANTVWAPVPERGSFDSRGSLMPPSAQLLGPPCVDIDKMPQPSQFGHRRLEDTK
jgi:hypothetical protein